MDIENLFSYINPRQKNLDTLLESIEKLNFGKLSYSVQELQSMDILSDENKNKRILEDTEEYLGLCNEFLYENRVDNSSTGELLSDSLEKRKISDDIDINLSDLKGKIFTLADLSFKANKLTKMLCEQAIQTVVGKNTHSDGNLDLKNVIKQLEAVYRNSNNETGKRMPVKEQLVKIKDNLIAEPDNRWRKNLDSSISGENALELLFNDLCPIWHVRDVLYEIKSQLNTELIRCLIEDNYTEFKNWGFSRDENNKLVFNFDSRQVVERYGYHVPMMDKLLSTNLIEQLEQNNIPYELDFTSIVRKNNMDRVIDVARSNGQNFLTGYKTRLIELLKSVDLENYTPEQYAKVNELYILGKFMSVGTRDRLIEEYPELEKQCNLLKELVNPSRENKQDLSNINVNDYQTEYEKYIMKQIEEVLMRTKTVYMQKGNNLDKQASKYAIRKHMKDKYGMDIQVIEIDAGENIIGDGLFVDAGKLEGIGSYGKIYEGRKRRVTINANSSRAQKSTCGVLSQYGFYVPDKIVQYADGVSDERILLPRYGINISRYLVGQKLFDFAEAKREDGTYLFESELTDDELKYYSTEPNKGNKGTNLLELCEKRQKQIERDTQEIAENIYVIHTEQGDKYAAVMDHIVNCGAMISYSLGCDYYVSVASERLEGTDKKDDHYNPNRATFTVDANPRKGDGRLPDKLLKWCEELRDNGENDIFKMVTVQRVLKNSEKNITRKEDEKPFVKPTKDMVVFGGPKTPHLFVEYKDKTLPSEEPLKEAIIYEITDLMDARAIKKDDKIQVVKDSMKNWKNISAKSVASKILFDNKELTLTDVESEINKIEQITNEKGGIEHDDITPN